MKIRKNVKSQALVPAVIEPPAVRTTPPPEPELIPIITTWNRNLDLLNLNGWQFQIRHCVMFGSSERADLTYLALDRAELERLSRVIQKVLNVPVGARPESLSRRFGLRGH